MIVMTKSLVDTSSAEYVPQAAFVSSLLQVTVVDGPSILTVTELGVSMMLAGLQ